MQPEFDQAELQNLFTGLSERIPQLVWTAGDDGRWTWASSRWVAYTGLSGEASQGYGWQTAIHPSDRGAMVSGWRSARERGQIDVEHRLLAADGSGGARWFTTRSKPVADANGSGHIWLGTCTDIDDIKLMQKRQQPLLRQLEGRVANVVALTRFVSRHTAKTSDSLESYALHLDSRLEAIARLQVTLMRDPQAGVDLATIVTDKLLAYAVHESDRVYVAGPAVRLRGDAADLICLSVHELVMNAVEHGAFAVPLGRLAVTWTLERMAGGRALRIEWLETGIDDATASRRRSGFGTELIERVLYQQLGATALLGFDGGGVQCTIVVPLSTDIFTPERGGSNLLG